MIIALLLLGAVALAPAACTTVAGTNRKQFNVYSTSEEKSMGQQAYQEEMKGAKVLSSGPVNDRIQTIGARIAAAAKQRYPEMANSMAWQWTVVDDPKMVNAWMLPGGYGAVYTGIIDFAQSDDEIAVVMGHEASHAIARHGGERMSSGAAAQLGAAAAGAATNSSAVAQAAALGLQGGVLLPYSRMQESEADNLGLLIAAQAGYDPRTAITLWKRMQSRGGTTFEWLSTHPSEGTRIERLQEEMPEAYAIYKKTQGEKSSAAPTAPAGTPAPASNAAPKGK
ncbi:MAG: M48 family metallopeptidase [Planctomycetes bacterium]|nr:M48 family metallopeptidase [Planctomycetota bacterium]